MERNQARGPVIHAIGEVRRLHRPIEHLTRVIAAIVNSTPYPTVGHAHAERLEALWTRASVVHEACQAICDAVDAVLGTPGGQEPAKHPAQVNRQWHRPPRPQPAGGNVGPPEDPQPDDASSESVQSATEEDQTDETPIDDEESDDGADAGPPPPAAVVPPAAVTNRIVWADEQDSPNLIRGMRHYRFTIHASPVELAAEPKWTGLQRYLRPLDLDLSHPLGDTDPPVRTGFEFMARGWGSVPTLTSIGCRRPSTTLTTHGFT